MKIARLMKPTPADALYWISWITERILYFICFLLILFGATFAGIFSTKRADLPVHKQIVTVLFGVTLMGCVAGYLIKNYNIDPYLMGMLSAFMGMGADRMSHWLLSIWEKSEGIEDFVNRVVKIVLAFRKAINDTDPDKQPPTS